MPEITKEKIEAAIRLVMAEKGCSREEAGKIVFNTILAKILNIRPKAPRRRR